MEAPKVVHAHGEHLIDGSPMPDEFLISPPGVWPPQYCDGVNHNPDRAKEWAEDEPAADKGWTTPFG